MARLAANTPAPGYLTLNWLNPARCCTDSRVGKSPVAIEFCSSTDGVVR